ncbi:hypothetical protein [Amycolatopsis sp. NPDC058986]|uniref:hypothetical protein n=1 Tax=unclassified Amycolatopsis TaxID=2618356 RepID=UPI00366D62C2
MTTISTPRRIGTVVRYRLRAGFTVDRGLSWARMVLDEDSGLELDGESLRVRVGHWHVPICLSNVAGAEVTEGCLPSERGVTAFPEGHGLIARTTTGPGVRIRCREPVPGAGPFDGLWHSMVTVTVGEPAVVADLLTRVAGGHRALA